MKIFKHKTFYYTLLFLVLWIFPCLPLMTMSSRYQEEIYKRLPKSEWDKVYWVFEDQRWYYHHGLMDLTTSFITATTIVVLLFVTTKILARNNK